MQPLKEIIPIIGFQAARDNYDNLWDELLEYTILHSNIANILIGQDIWNEHVIHKTLNIIINEIESKYATIKI